MVLVGRSEGWIEFESFVDELDSFVLELATVSDFSGVGSSTVSVVGRRRGGGSEDEKKKEDLDQNETRREGKEIEGRETHRCRSGGTMSPFLSLLLISSTRIRMAY